MKVFIVSGKNPRLDPGGYAAYAMELGECLSDLGHEIHFMSFGPRDTLIETNAGPIHVIGSTIIPRRTEFYPLWGFAFAEAILRILPKQAAEPVAIHGIGPWCLAGALVKERRPWVEVLASYFTTVSNETRWLSKGVALSDHGFGPKLKHLAAAAIIAATLHPIERYALSRTDKVFVHYEYTRRLLAAEMKLDVSRVTKIPYAVNLEPKLGSSKPRTVTKGEFEILNVGRQEPRKGINIMLRALQILSARGVSFHATIVGSGSLLEAHRALASRLGIADQVDFPGFVPDLAPYLEAADVFVLPSLQEGSGSISLLEAMMYGCPAVVSACDGLVEDIQDRVNGMLVRPMDPRELANALEILAGDPQLRSRLGDFAKDTYRERFRRDGMREGLRAHYPGSPARGKGSLGAGG